MNVKCFNFMIFLLSLHVTLKSTTAAISRKDVESCISEVKMRLENQQNTAKKRFNELRTRKLNDMKEQRDERRDNLVAFIQNEKNILSTLKQSAIQDNFNVTMCNDTSTVYDLVSSSFQSSADAILADYSGVVGRNHTQNSVLVDRLALSYQQLEQKLAKCPDQSSNTECFDEVEDYCEMAVYKNDIIDLESSYYADAERVFVAFKTKLVNLYNQKLGDAQSFSNEMRTCYKNIKNINSTSTTDQQSDSGVSLQPLKYVLVLPFLYKFIF